MGSTAPIAGASSSAIDQGIGAASAGAEPISDSGTGAALLTDDSILGITEDTGTSSPTTAATTETAATPAAIPAELSVDDFKALFPTNPKLQSLWDKYSSSQSLVTKFGTVADAGKAADVVQMLGGVEHLESLAQKAASVDQTDATFFGGQPAERKQLANDWYDGEGPHEFGITSKAVYDQTKATVEVMSQRDPEGYASFRSEIVNEVLQQHQFGAYLQNIAAAYQKAGQAPPPEVQQLLSWASRYGLDKQAGKGQSPEEQRLAADRAKLDADRNSFSGQRQAEAIQAADTQIGTGVTASIDKALTELKVNGKSVFGPQSTQIKQTIAGQVRVALDEALAKNPVLVAQVTSIKARGLGAAQQKEMVDAVMRHAGLMLPKVLESVMAPWTKSVVSQAGATAQRAKDGASKVDVGSGSTSGGSTKPKLTIKDVKEKGMTPEQILDF